MAANRSAACCLATGYRSGRRTLSARLILSLLAHRFFSCGAASRSAFKNACNFNASADAASRCLAENGAHHLIFMLINVLPPVENVPVNAG
jgi:hypothetical protein